MSEEKPEYKVPTDDETIANILKALDEVGAEGNLEEVERLSSLLAKIYRLRGEE
jgi:hypothetical protein